MCGFKTDREQVSQRECTINWHNHGLWKHKYSIQIHCSNRRCSATLNHCNRHQQQHITANVTWLYNCQVHIHSLPVILLQYVRKYKRITVFSDDADHFTAPASNVSHDARSYTCQVTTWIWICYAHYPMLQIQCRPNSSLMLKLLSPQFIRWLASNNHRHSVSRCNTDYQMSRKLQSRVNLCICSWWSTDRSWMSSVSLHIRTTHHLVTHQGAYSSLMSYIRHENFRTTTFVRRLRRIHKSVRRPKLFCVSYVRIRTYESFQAKLYVFIK